MLRYNHRALHRAGATSARNLDRKNKLNTIHYSLAHFAHRRNVESTIEKLRIGNSLKFVLSLFLISVTTNRQIHQLKRAIHEKYDL